MFFVGMMCTSFVDLVGDIATYGGGVVKQRGVAVGVGKKIEPYHKYCNPVLTKTYVFSM